MNSWIKGKWQKEDEVALPSAFLRNRPFEVKIEAKRKKFVVQAYIVTLTSNTYRSVS
jgi:hypothetical protein